MIGRVCLAAACLWALLMPPAQALVDSSAGAVEMRQQQRAAYRQALNHLSAGRTAAFRELADSLADYPLAPYLAYFEMQSRLSSLTDAEMQEFQVLHGDLPAARILYFRWLKSLGTRREWSRLVANYQTSTDAELNCLHQRALLATGRREQAMAGVAPLWVVGNSQPNACDPLFEAWIAGGYLSEGLAWERLQLALNANERGLARYLLRFFDGPLRTWAQTLHDVHVDPTQVARLGVLKQDHHYARTVIAHGLRRLARQDAAAAFDAWRRFDDSHTFDPETRQAVTEAVTLAQARRGTFPSRSAALGAAGAASGTFIAGMAEAALAVQNWGELVYWIDRMPAEQQADLRWQYWLARGLARTEPNSERARQTYRALAGQRNYYGFLAAGQIGETVRIHRNSVEVNAATIAELQRLPPMQRALELYEVGDRVNSRRELFALIPSLPPAQKYHAVQLTQQAGWLTQGILLANTPELFDSLELRFPVAYPELFQRASTTTAVAKPFLLAVARQESAFDPGATSSANARGLMQLMHPTANYVARRLGRPEPSVRDLFDPTLNVELGAHHLARLMQRYRHQRPLAAAAYNAGEGRVDRWIRERSQIPMDVWIESIPFPETRNYVKNVLAFNQVYGYLLSMPSPMLEVHEAEVGGGT